jgi:isoleucyl-tRNA synthetase
MGADVMRWMYLRQNPVYNLRFGYNIAKEVKRKLLILWNSYLFFETYVLKNKERQFEFWGEEEINKREITGVLNKWILSRLNRVIEKVKDNLDGLQVDRASQAIEDFFINDFSLWFIRRSRKIFQSSGDEKEREESENVFYFVLLNLLKLTAPFMPFFSEEIYSHLRQEDMPVSIHLSDWPISNKEKVDVELEEKMKKTREIAALALAKRAEAGLKIRMPLPALAVKDRNKVFPFLLKEELNVKEVLEIKAGDNLKEGEEIILDTETTPELEKEGMVREFIRAVNMLRKKGNLTPEDKIKIYYQTDKEIKEVLEEKESLILESTAAETMDVLGSESQYNLEKELKVFQGLIKLAIKKIK